MTALSTPTAENTLDLRTNPPAHLQTSIDSLLEAFASTESTPGATRYLPDDFLSLLIG